jgi:hypothetical protein
MALHSLDRPKADQLLREIDAFCLKRQKSNRKLAKDVAAWVETAMKINADKQQARSGGPHGAMRAEDVDIDMDFDDEEDG